MNFFESDTFKFDKNAVETREKLKSSGGLELFEIGAIINSKVSALLTHVSVMIAVTAVILSFDVKHEWIKIILAIEIILYLVVTLLCLKSVNLVTNIVDFDYVLKELQGRARSYIISLRLTIVLTLILIVIIAIEKLLY